MYSLSVFWLLPALHQPSAALRAAARHLDHERHGEAAFGIAGAGEEGGLEAAGLDDELASAFGADLLRLLVGHLEMDALELLFRLLEIGFKAAVKFTQNILPRDLAPLDGVESFPCGP